MTFLSVALSSVARGWKVFPCKPGNKSPLTAHGFKDASGDEAQIREWWRKHPSANIGIACGASGLCVLDIDHGLADEGAFHAWRLTAGVTETYSVRTGRRPGFGVQLYYLGTMPDVALFELNGCKGQIKSLGGYVMAVDSLHPSGEKYQVLRDVELSPIPEIVRALKTVRPTVTSGPMEKIPEGGGRHAKLASVAGKLRYSGLDKEALLAALIPINESMCEVPVPIEDLKHIAHSIGTLYPVPAPEPKILIGGKDPTAPRIEVPPEVDGTEAKTAPRPVYCDAVWDGTLFGEFADIVSADNFIPKKFSSESFRVLTGAIVGDQLTCGVAGGRMREYLAVIGLRQSGKSWSKDCAVAFYTRPSAHFRFDPLLFHGGQSRYRPLRIGAQQFLPGSPNSFVDELNREDKERRGHTQKPGKEPTIKIEITSRWSPIPRYITIQGEAMSLFARFGNEWTGQALSALLTDLYDGTEAEVAVTSERGSPKLPVRLQYSMMLYTQPLIWRKYMAEQVMDSRLFGRFYIVGSEQKPQQVPLPDYENDPELFHSQFGALRREMFSRIEYLSDHPMVLKVVPEAKKKIQSWLETIATDHDDGIDRASRMGIHVYRAALARAWGATKQRLEITEEDADAAILLGQYQVEQRVFYAPVLGDNPKAKALNLVRQTIRRAGQISLRELKKQVHAERFSEQFEWSLGWLQNRGEVLAREEGNRRKLIIWLDQSSPK